MQENNICIFFNSINDITFKKQASSGWERNYSSTAVDDLLFSAKGSNIHFTLFLVKSNVVLMRWFTAMVLSLAVLA